MGKDSASFDSKGFEDSMEEFGLAMERWGESFAKTFENQEWDKFGHDMELWGQGLAQHIFSDDSPEMQELHQNIERLQLQLDKTDDPNKKSALEDEIEALSEELGELHAQSLEQSTREFEQKMEDWGERYAAKMEHWADEHAERMEEHARKMEDHAEEARKRADADAERADDAVNVLGKRMARDGLINSPESFKLKITDKDMFVNGKRQSNEMHRKYSKLVEELMDTELDEDGVTINHRGK